MLKFQSHIDNKSDMLEEITSRWALVPLISATNLK